MLHAKTCTICGAGYTSRRSDTLYCSRECNSLAYGARRKGNGRLKRPTVAFPTCHECGEVIRRVGSIMHGDCHRACRARRQARANVRTRLAARIATPLVVGKTPNPEWAWVQGVCEDCGEYFVRKGGASPYCSKACKPRGATWKVSDRLRRSIYDRDDWTCQLCFEPVDPDLAPNQDWAASLDHIVCVVHGGDESPENLRLAHRWCNSVRGDETHYTAADLVAV